MQNTFVPPSEQQVIQRYNQLKQVLLTQSKNQMDSAFRVNNQMTQLFQSIFELFNILTNKIAALKQENIELKLGNRKSKLKNQYQDQRLDHFGEFDQKQDDGVFRAQSNKNSNLLKKYYEGKPSQLHNLTKFQQENTKIHTPSVNTIKLQPYEQSNEEEEPQDKKMIKQMNQRKQEKLTMKKQYAIISRYVKEYIAPYFVYDKDHKRYMVPKKHILHEYFRWCKANNRPILQNKSSVIQMCLTNQLKLLFPSMDSYTKNYRGLRKSNSSNVNHLQPYEHYVDQNQDRIYDLNQ